MSTSRYHADTRSSHNVQYARALEAVEKTMAKSERLMQGKEGGVIGIVAMCSFLIPSGACLGDLADQKSSPFVDVYVSRRGFS